MPKQYGESAEITANQPVIQTQRERIQKLIAPDREDKSASEGYPILEFENVSELRSNLIFKLQKLVSPNKELQVLESELPNPPQISYQINRNQTFEIGKNLGNLQRSAKLQG